MNVAKISIFDMVNNCKQIYMMQH